MNTTVDVKTDGDNITIREGRALELKEPTPLRIIGVIDAPLSFLSQRMGTLMESDCHILVNRETGTILLTVDERSFYKDTITGKIDLSAEFNKFGINSGQYHTPYDLSQLFKMNRSYFENQSVAMGLVSVLMNFKAKVEKEMEKSENGRGDRRVLMAQTVASNIPEKFNLCIPVFRGMPKQVFEVEIMINPSDLTCTLQSPQANDLIYVVKDELINSTLLKIQEIAPEIVIIEQ